MITRQCPVPWTTGTELHAFPAQGVDTLPSEKQRQALLEHCLVDLML